MLWMCWTVVAVLLLFSLLLLLLSSSSFFNPTLQSFSRSTQLSQTLSSSSRLGAWSSKYRSLPKIPRRRRLAESSASWKMIWFRSLKRPRLTRFSTRTGSRSGLKCDRRRLKNRTEGRSDFLSCKSPRFLTQRPRRFPRARSTRPRATWPQNRRDFPSSCWMHAFCC